MEHEHTHEAIRERFAAGPSHSYLRDWVYGGIDGTVTTFALVSGVVGADLSSCRYSGARRCQSDRRWFCDGGW